MNKLIFDVGLHKTGSTSRQYFYSKLTNINYIGPPVSLSTLKIIENDKPTIISHEALSGISHSPDEILENRLNIAYNIKRSYPDARIIICIRDMDSWKKSAFKQYSYSCYAYSWDEYWKKYDKQLLDFDGYIKFLESLFKEVYICYFEDLKSNPDDYYKGICDFIGIDMPKNFRNVVLNKAVPNHKVKIMFLIDSIFKSKRLHTVLSTLIRELIRLNYKGD